MCPQRDISCIVDEAFSDVDRILLLSDNERIIEKFQSFSCVDKIVFAVTKDNLYETMLKAKINVIQLPMYFSSYNKTVDLVLEIALKQEFLEKTEHVVVMSNMISERIDTMNMYDLSNFKVSGFYDILTLSGKIETNVLKSIISLAIEMGRKGSEGKQIGAIFIVGDSKLVMQKSTAISLNPFESRRAKVTDPVVKSMVKEFSLLDGAFVINEKGAIVAAHRYLKADPQDIDIPQGLGARHISTAAMTTVTDAMGIVLSESDNLIRVFNDGKIVLEIDPAEYK